MDILSHNKLVNRSLDWTDQHLSPIPLGEVPAEWPYFAIDISSLGTGVTLQLSTHTYQHYRYKGLGLHEQSQQI